MSFPDPEPPRFHRYLVEPGSETERMIEQFEDERNHRKQEWGRLIKQYKANASYGNDRDLLGMVFVDLKHPPQGFRLKQGSKAVYVPDLRSRLGREIFQQFEDAFIPGWREFTWHMGAVPVQTGWHGFVPVYTDFHWEQVDGWTIMVVPRTLSGVRVWPPPPDVKPLLDSEYWLHREQAGLI